MGTPTTPLLCEKNWNNQNFGQQAVSPIEIVSEKEEKKKKKQKQKPIVTAKLVSKLQRHLSCKESSVINLAIN